MSSDILTAYLKHVYLHIHLSDHTIDYQARHHVVDFEFTPYYGVTPLSFTDAQKTLQLEYRKTVLHWDRKHTKTSGLDPLGVRPHQRGFPRDPHADPEMPIANATYDHLSVDAEGLVVNDDGTYVTAASPRLLHLT